MNTTEHDYGERITEVVKLLERIAGGTHDPTPTRRLIIDNPDAAAVDVWWQNYYTSNDTSLKKLARAALMILAAKGD
jgi:hypothetical protein